MSGLLYGTQHYSVYWLYFIAFAVVIIGLIIYFWSAPRTSHSIHPLGVMLTRLVLVAEAQGKIEPRIPAYIERQRETVHIVAGQV